MSRSGANYILRIIKVLHDNSLDISVIVLASDGVSMVWFCARSGWP